MSERAAEIVKWALGETMQPLVEAVRRMRPVDAVSDDAISRAEVLQMFKSSSLPPVRGEQETLTPADVRARIIAAVGNRYNYHQSVGVQAVIDLFPDVSAPVQAEEPSVNIRDWLLAFLKQLEALCPPVKNGHHALTSAQYGSDDTGWSDRLALHVWDTSVTPPHSLTFFVDKDDVEHDPLAVAEAVAASVRQSKAKTALSPLRAEAETDTAGAIANRT